MAGETVSLVSAFGLDEFRDGDGGDEGFVRASDTTSVGSRLHGGTE